MRKSRDVKNLSMKTRAYLDLIFTLRTQKTNKAFIIKTCK
jgi:hypothetical protein